MLNVGLTGGIGAGKSTVADILRTMGYPVFNSDLVAKQITQSHPKVKEELIRVFGEELYQGDNLDRAKLAAIIFSDSKAKTFVNELIHPLVREAYWQWSESTTSPIVFNEAAILFETGAWRQFEKIILVIAPEEVRIRRVMNRDNVTKADVLARMNQQWSDDKKSEMANYVIVNDDNQPVLRQVEEIISRLQTI